MLRLSAEHLEAIASWARAALPEEACGLILGRVESSIFVVSSVERLANIEMDSPQSRYRLDPQDIYKIGRAARARAEGLIGVWHSHPEHSADPSAADLDGAWADSLYLIYGPVTSTAAELRAWRLNEAETGFVEIPWQLREGAAGLD